MAAPEPSKSARVRELCRRLKPVIGARADRIWQAWLIESETGKRQLLDYLEILAAREFHGELNDVSAGLVPPSKTTAAGEYEIGQVHYHGRDLYPFGLRESEWTQHVGVYGRSGAGKTNLGIAIVQDLVKKGKPTLVFDWKRTYRAMLKLPGLENAAVYTVGRSIAPFTFNPLIPPPGTNPKTWLKKLIAVIAHAYLLGNGVLYLLQETIDKVYESFGVYEGRVDRWPTFRDIREALNKRQSGGREAGWQSSALRALASLTFGDMDRLVNEQSDNIDALLEQTAILELDALTQSDKVFFIQALLLWIHHRRMDEATREQFKHAIVIEEAHHVLTGERQSLVGGQSVMELTFREIREFGEGLIILDQHPSQISTPALGNTYATFCFNLKHRSDVNAMSQAMLLEDEEKNLLGSLPVGTAVVRLQGRGERPFTIRVPEVPIEKGSVSDDDVLAHMLKLGLTSLRKTADQATGATNQAAESQNIANVEREDSNESEKVGNEMNNEMEMFLRDVQRYRDSGIAERYRRLGWSVRHGQKVKEALVKDGLILE